jgi:hypothetical protein
MVLVPNNTFPIPYWLNEREQRMRLFCFVRGTTAPRSSLLAFHDHTKTHNTR